MSGIAKAMRGLGEEIADFIVSRNSFRYGVDREGDEFVGRLERIRFAPEERSTTVVIARGATEREASVRLDARMIAMAILRMAGASSVVVTWPSGHVETVEKKARRR